MSITDDQLNNDIDLAQDLTNRTTTNIIVDSSNLANGDLLQYDSSSRQFEPRTPSEMSLYTPGGTDVALADGGTGASTAAGARTNLELGTIATQNSNNVTITGGSINGITDLAVADGGTGASTLTGVVIGNGTSAFTAQAPLSVSNGGTGASTLTGVLQGNGTSAVTAGTVGVPLGGTGLTSATAYAVLCGGTTSTGAFQSIASVGTSGQILVSNGAAALPTFQNSGSVNGALKLIQSQSASTSATIDFTGIGSTYKSLYLILDNIIPSTDDVTLNMRIGTGGGPTYASTNEYDYLNHATHTTGTEVVAGATSAAQMLLVPSGSTTTNLGSSTGENLTAAIWIDNPSDSSTYSLMHWQCSGYSSGGVPVVSKGTGTYKATTAITALRFLMSSGNIASGTFTLYGVLNA